MVLFTSITAFTVLASVLSVTARSTPVHLSNGLQSRQAQLPGECTEFCSPLAGCLCIERPTNCVANYTVDAGENCGTIVNRFNNFTATDLFLWNPEILQTCTGLRAYVPVCIGVPGYQYPGPVKGGHKRRPRQTPVPVMTVVPNCELWEYTDTNAQPSFAALLKENKITQEQWNTWNWPDKDPKGSYAVFGGYFSCVAVSG